VQAETRLVLAGYARLCRVKDGALRLCCLMLRSKAAIYRRNARNMPSVRDRGVGGSNPLAPTINNPEEDAVEGPGNRAFRVYGQSFHDVPGSVTRCGEVSLQLPIWLPECYRKA